MKKLIVAALALMCSAGTYAQNIEIGDVPFDASTIVSESSSTSYYDRKNEFYIQYGQLSFTGLAYMIGVTFGTAFSLGQASFQNSHMCGALSLGYFRHLNDWLSVGGIITADFNDADQYTKDSNKEYQYYGYFTMASATVLPAVKAYWFKRPKYAMYSTLAVGPALYYSGTHTTNSDTSGPTLSWNVGGQISLVGIEFGSETGTWRGMAEFGAGNCGLVTVGVKKAF